MQFQCGRSWIWSHSFSLLPMGTHTPGCRDVFWGVIGRTLSLTESKFEQNQAISLDGPSSQRRPLRRRLQKMLRQPRFADSTERRVIGVLFRPPFWAGQSWTSLAFIFHFSLFDSQRTLRHSRECGVVDGNRSIVSNDHPANAYLVVSRVVSAVLFVLKGNLKHS
jgi:hypothetical protein